MKDYDYEEEREKAKLGPVMTCCMIFKATIGVGIFTFPYAYGLCGLVLGSIVSATVFYMVTYGIDTLLGLCDQIESREGKLHGNNPGQDKLINPEDKDDERDQGGSSGSDRRSDNIYTVEYQVQPGRSYEIITYHQVPNRIKGSLRAPVTLVSIVASVGMCLGFGLGNYVYLIKAVAELTGQSTFISSVGIYLFSTVLLLLIIEPEKIKFVATIIASFILFSSLVLFCHNYYEIARGRLADSYTYSEPKNMGIVVGVALFAFESISLIINVRRTTRNKKKMRTYTRWTFFLASIFFLLLAFSFHMVFGNQIHHTIAFDYFKVTDSFSLSNGQWIFYLKYFVALNPLFAVPFSTITIIEIFEKVKPLSVYLRSPSTGQLSPVRIFTMRLGLLTSIFLCTLLTSRIEIIFDIVGSLFGPILGFIVPVSVYHSYNRHRGDSISTGRIIHDIVYVFIGIGLGTLGIIYTFQE